MINLKADEVTVDISKKLIAFFFQGLVLTGADIGPGPPGPWPGS